MAANELKLEEILDYFKEKGGVVSNRELVHHFKKYLTDARFKDEARISFKKYVNFLAHAKTENNEKLLYLKSKFLNSSEGVNTQQVLQQYDSRSSLGLSTPSREDSASRSSLQPPPYRSPPPVVSPSPSDISSHSVISTSIFDQSNSSGTTPQAPPRRRSLDKQKSVDEHLSIDKVECMQGDWEADGQAVSVRERTQKFNRLASIEDELSPSPKFNRDKSKSRGVDEDDGASVTSLLDPKKCMEWFVTASRGDYQELVKLAKLEPRLVTKKDPFTAYTVLHWGAKHGNADIIKVFAGKYKVDVNGKTNGGYTPLHIAAQFGHKDVYKLLETTYKADSKIRDYSGRIAGYYLECKEQRGSITNLRSEYNFKPQHVKLIPARKSYSFRNTYNQAYKTKKNRNKSVTN